MGDIESAWRNETGIAYLRASSGAIDGPGIQAQRSAIEAWADSTGVRIRAWHVEVVPGAAPLKDRPEMMAAIRDLGEMHAGFIVVSQRDRLARDAKVAGEIEELVGDYAARVVSVDPGGAEAAFCRVVLAAVDRYNTRGG